jgi:uncharacterized membrane protein YdfJ with MMPL/SSD domain
MIQELTAIASTNTGRVLIAGCIVAAIMIPALISLVAQWRAAFWHQWKLTKGANDNDTAD